MGTTLKRKTNNEVVGVGGGEGRGQAGVKAVTGECHLPTASQPRRCGANETPQRSPLHRRPAGNTVVSVSAVTARGFALPEEACITTATQGLLMRTLDPWSFGSFWVLWWTD